VQDIELIFTNLNKDNLPDFLKIISDAEKPGEPGDVIKKLVNILKLEKFPSNIPQDMVKKVKLSIIKTLTVVKDKESVEGLIGALKTDNTLFKNAIAKALGDIKCESAVEPLLELLKDDHSKVSGIKALGDIGGESVVLPIINMLNDKDGEVRSTAVNALGQIKDKRAVEELIKALETDTDVNVRRLSAIALGDIKAEKAVPVLIKKLNDQFMNVSTSAADALVKIGEPSVKALIEVIDNKLASDALRKIGEPAIDEFINALNHENEDVRAIAAVSLGKLKSTKAIKPLVKALRYNFKYKIADKELEGLKNEVTLEYIRDLVDKEFGEEEFQKELKKRSLHDLQIKFIMEYSKKSGKALKAMKDAIFFICSSSLSPLLEALDGADEGCYESISEIFFDIGNLKDDGLEILTAELVKSEHPIFQQLIIKSMARFGDTSIFPTLKDIFLKTRCDKVKIEILKTINQLGAREDMFDFFKKALDENNEEVREQAAQAIISTGDPSTVSLLVKLLSEEKRNIRYISVKGLGQINHPDTITPLLNNINSQDNKLRLTVIKALSKKCDASVTSALIELLKDNSTEIQIAAVQALKKIGDKSAISNLKSLRNTSDEKLREEIEKTLQELGVKKGFWDKLLHVFKKD